MADVQRPSSHDNFGGPVDRPNMPHRASSTENIPPEQDTGAPIQRVASNTVPRASHRGAAHAESKPYKHDPQAEPVNHDGSVPQKIDVDGPPQPDWDRAERERQERREQQQKAEQEGGNKDYPEQIHAGQVGVGPSIANRHRASFSEKLTGLKEVILGKLHHKPETVHHGHDMMTGDLKLKQQEEEDRKMAEKFDKPQAPEGAKAEQAPAGATAE